MPQETADLLTPRILVVDDERQIHASLRLRLGQRYELEFAYNAREALEKVARERFDLCIADIHMPNMDGLKFIEAAQAIDPDLGYIVLSAFDSADNLRRAIPLRVYEFIDKPLPEKKGFEHRMPEWIERTRRRRREQALAHQAGTIAQDLQSARLEREVELVASESARDALLQTASLLTTIHAQLVTATQALAVSGGKDAAPQLLRELDEARRTADAAVTVASGFFDSAYARRDSSPALVKSGAEHAIGIARRIADAETANKSIELAGCDDQVPLPGLSGIQFLLMMVPAVGLALMLAAPNSTLRIQGETLARLDDALRDPRARNLLWVNRKDASHPQPAIVIVISAAAPAPSRDDVEAWLKGDANPFPAITARGLVAGIRQCRGLLAFATAPSPHFGLWLVLPI